MTALSIVALCIFIFGAYAYGSVVVLSLRHRSPVWSPAPAPFQPEWRIHVLGLAMFIACTLWFVLHSIIEFRSLVGEARDNDLIDLAALELVFFFPALIFQTVLMEAGADSSGPRRAGALWTSVVIGLYAAAVALALYVPAVIYDFLPQPDFIFNFINFSIGLLFMISSVCCIAVMTTRSKPTQTPDQRNMRKIMTALFLLMIASFFVLTLMRDREVLMQVLVTSVRTLPLAFFVVSVYFENRIEFYDLVIKRGVLLILTLLIGGAAFAVTLGWLDGLPPGPARPWLYAVVLLPVAMVMPWLHNRVGRLLDRMWFGREFTPVQAVKHVLAAMQQATDEFSLVAAAEATLTDMFRKRIVIVLEDQPVPDTGAVALDVRTPGSGALIKIVVINDPGSRAMLSEDLALLRSLTGVFGFMLENVRLHRKRQEQEKVAQELRLQTSRSELKALRAQINPHFLFNALNAIASLIHTDPARADAAVEQLAEVFRYTLRRSDSEWAPLDQELAFARAYLDVEQARFGKRLSFSIDADGAAERAQVPSMLLQTLVENAVKHGISRLRQPGHIKVRAFSTDGQLTLEVRDTGEGLGQQPTHLRAPSGESFGLRSVRDRLQGHFGNRAALELTRDDVKGETIARITMPLTTEELSTAHA